MDTQERIARYRKEIATTNKRRRAMVIERRKIISGIVAQLLDMLCLDKITLYRNTYSFGWINEKSIIDFTAIKEFDLPIYRHTIWHPETGSKVDYLFSEEGDFLLKVDSSVLYNKA